MKRLIALLCLAAYSPFAFGVIWIQPSRFAVAGYDADAQTYFDNITANGGTISVGRKNAINTYVVGCKSAGIWTKLLDDGPLYGDDYNACLVKLKKLSTDWTYTAVNFVSGDYSASAGLTGNGSTKYLNTGVNASVDLSTNAAGMMVRTSSSVSGTAAGHGARTGSSANFGIYATYSDNHLYANAYTDANDTDSGAITGTIGTVHAVRAASNSLKLYRNGTLVDTNTTPGGGLPNKVITFFALNDSSVSDYSNQTIQHCSLVSDMSDSEVAAHATLVAALHAAR